MIFVFGYASIKLLSNEKAESVVAISHQTIKQKIKERSNMPGIKGKYIYDDKGNIIGATGGLKTAMTNKQKYGSEWYKKIGSNGGKAKVPKGFGKNESLASRAGRKGGSKNRRKFDYNTLNQMIEMHKQHFSKQQIADKVGTTYGIVSRRISEYESMGYTK